MGVSGVISECFKGVKGKGVFQGSYIGVAWVLHVNCMGVSRVLVDCHNGVIWAL